MSGAQAKAALEAEACFALCLACHADILTDTCCGEPVNDARANACFAKHLAKALDRYSIPPLYVSIFLVAAFNLHMEHRNL